MDAMVTKHGLQVHYIAWETDESCIAITRHHYPDMERRGDIFKDSSESVADRINFLDPKGE